MRKHFKFILLLLFTGLLLWWFGRKLNWTEVRASLNNANWYLLTICVLLVCLTYLLRAYRWRALLAPLTKTNLREIFLATTVGFGILFLLGRAGEVVRPAVLSLRSRDVSPSAAFITIFIERLFDMAATIAAFALCLFFLSPPNAERAGEFAYVRLVGFALLAGIFAALIFLAVFRVYSQPIIERLSARLNAWRVVPDRLSRIIISTLEQLAQALSVLANARELAVVSFWTAAIWFIIVFYTWLIFLALHLPFGLAEATFVMGWSIVGSMAPTPGGGAGAFHAATAAGLLFLGHSEVSTEDAAAFSLLSHLIGFAPALIFAFYYLLRGDINISRLKQITNAETVEHAVEDNQLEVEPAAPLNAPTLQNNPVRVAGGES